jgi:hypothetical protein
VRSSFSLCESRRMHRCASDHVCVSVRMCVCVYVCVVALLVAILSILIGSFYYYLVDRSMGRLSIGLVAKLKSYESIMGLSPPM